jgi:nitrous oxidase accessory protein NosD
LRALAAVGVIAAGIAGSAGQSTAAPVCARAASPSGSDSAPGTPSAPFRTAQRLADSLAPGETGCLRAGTYEQSVTITRAGTTLRSWPGEHVTLLGRLWVERGADGVTVEGLFLDGRNAKHLPSPTINAGAVTFRGNDVTNRNTGICFLLGASDMGNNVKWGRADEATIESNRIHDCGRLPATNHDHGVYVEAASGARIAENWIYDNADRGVQLYPDAQRTLVTGNVIDGNGTGVIFSGEGGTASSDNVVEGNVITNSDVRENVESWWGGEPGHGNVVRGNCVHGGAGDHGDGGINAADGGFESSANLMDAPGFVNRRANDFRLAQSSPCRGVARTPESMPGPPRPKARGARHRAVTISVRSRPARGGRRLVIRGHARARSGRLVTIRIRSRRGAHVLARTHVRREGRFRAVRRVHARRGPVRVVAVLANGARSRSVRVRGR